MGEPKHVTRAQYRVVTPMFLAGADQNGAEMRLPSFKGALRFWWRAISAQRFDQTKELRDAEDALFGSTRTGVSRIRMRLSKQDVRVGSCAEFPRNSWRSYIGFGLVGKEENRACIEPGSIVCVELSAARCTDEQWKGLREALVALGLFGGLGGRARNGWGSLTLESLSGAGGPWNLPTDISTLRRAIASHLGSSTSLRDWTAITARSCYALGPTKSTGEEAHEWLAMHYRTYIKGIVTVPEREAFGLPRRHAGANASRRRASAVLLHVHHAGSDAAIPLALFLPSRFLKDQEEPNGGWEISQGFIQYLGQQA